MWSVLLTFLAVLRVYWTINTNCVEGIYKKKKRKTDWILRLLSFNIKNLLYFSLILPLLFFEGQIREAGTSLFMKPFNISQILSRLSLSKKDVEFFENFLYFSFAFLDKTLCKFWDQTTPQIINIFCNYLRQLLGASFVFATLPTCCNIK